MGLISVVKYTAKQMEKKGVTDTYNALWCNMINISLAEDTAGVRWKQTLNFLASEIHAICILMNYKLSQKRRP